MEEAPWQRKSQMKRAGRGQDWFPELVLCCYSVWSKHQEGRASSGSQHWACIPRLAEADSKQPQLCGAGWRWVGAGISKQGRAWTLDQHEKAPSEGTRGGWSAGSWDSMQGRQSSR